MCESPPTIRVALDEVADAHEEGDDRRRDPLADDERGQHADRHQRVRNDAAAERCPDHAAERGPTDQQHDAGADRERHQARRRVEQAEPFPDHHDEQHGPEDETADRDGASPESLALGQA